MSNYDIAKDEAAAAFLAYDQEKIVQALNLANDRDYLYITMLGRAYRIDRATGEVEWSDNDFLTAHPADHDAAMTLYDRLCYGQGAAPAGEFATLRALAPFQGSAGALGLGMFSRQAEAFDHDARRLAAACTALGGVARAGADVAFELPFFEDFPVLVRFWHSDEEFPATLEIYYDANALQFMHYETLWYAASHAFKRLQSLSQ